MPVQTDAAPARDLYQPISDDLPGSVYSQIRDLMYREFGISLGPRKKDFVIGRLAGRLRQTGARSFRDYFQMVMSDLSGEELSRMVDALTTNFTSFFREREHFEFLTRAAVPQWKSNARLCIWSAGCATGEEPYTIACWLAEAFGSALPPVRILATDISRRALETARRAQYPEDRFTDLPLAWRRRFLLQGQGRQSGWFQIKSEIRRMVEFQYLNLNRVFPEVGTFDAIFCRNVMIYFDEASRQALVQRLEDRLSAGGYFLPGHAESLSNAKTRLQLVYPAVYQRPLEKR